MGGVLNFVTRTNAALYSFMISSSSGKKGNKQQQQKRLS